MDIVFVQIPLKGKTSSDPEESFFYQKYWNKFSEIVEEDLPSLPIYDIKELPLWIAALGASVEKAGYSVQVVDLMGFNGPTIDYEGIENELRKVDSSIFALSPFTNNYSVAVEISKIIKKIFGKKSTVIFGGAHTSYTEDICLSNDSVDIVSKGEGDLILPRIMKAIFNNQDLYDIPSISWKKDGKIIHNESNKDYISADDLPLPAYHLIPQTFRGAIPYGRIYTSRGCAYNCAYCADTLYKRRKPIYQSIERSVKQAELMRKYFGVNLIYVGDESFTYNENYVREFAEAMKERNFKWVSQTRADLVNEKILGIMKDGNCKLIKYGAETANQHLLDLIRKGIKVEQVTKACEMAKDAGLSVLLYYMVGLPDESFETAEKTVSFAENLFKKKLIDLVEYYITTPYPGTDLYQNPQRYNLEIIGKTFDDWREDQPSVTNTRFLTNVQIFDLWKSGLKRFGELI